MTTPYVSALLALLLLTSFAKIATTLSICKEGLGLRGFGSSGAFLGLALAITFVSIEPQLTKIGGIDGLFSGKSVSELETHFKPYIESHSDSKIKVQFEKEGTLSFPRQILVFLLSEVRAAFLMGIYILVPFVLIDVLIANVLVLLSVTQISSQVIALPLKLLLFVAVDGWTLITNALVKASGG